MTDIQKGTHDLALLAASKYVDSNFQEYKTSGYKGLVSDLSQKYEEAIKLLKPNQKSGFSRQ